MDEILALFKNFAPVLRQAQTEIAALTSGLSRAVPALGSAATQGVGGLAGAAGGAGGLALGGAAGTAALLGPLTAGLAGLGKELATVLANPLAELATRFGAAAAPTREAMGGAAGALRGMTGALMGPLGMLTSAVGPFVQALNPSLMRLFHQALRDLMATFGVAFMPVVQHVVALFNELSATLAPAMHALAPILDNVMSILEGTLVPVIGMIADAFVFLAPVIEFVTSVLATLAEGMRVVYTVFRSAVQVLYDVVKQLFGGVDLKNAAHQFQDVIHQLIKYFVQFAAYVAKALGYLDPFAKALEKNLRDLEGQKPGQKAALENVRITGLEQIGKDLAVAAFSAVGGGGTRKKSEAEFLEELANMVKDIKDDKNKTLETFLAAMEKKIISGLTKGFDEDLKKLWDIFVLWWRTGRVSPSPVREGVDPVHQQQTNLGMV